MATEDFVWLRHGPAMDEDKIIVRNLENIIPESYISKTLLSK
jgi:hypothetical protein